MCVFKDIVFICWSLRLKEATQPLLLAASFCFSPLVAGNPGQPGNRPRLCCALVLSELEQPEDCEQVKIVQMIPLQLERSRDVIAALSGSERPGHCSSRSSKLLELCATYYEAIQQPDQTSVCVPYRRELGYCGTQNQKNLHQQYLQIQIPAADPVGVHATAAASRKPSSSGQRCSCSLRLPLGMDAPHRVIALLLGIQPICVLAVLLGGGAGAVSLAASVRRVGRSSIRSRTATGGQQYIAATR